MFFKGTRQTLPGISGESKVPRVAAEHQDFFIIYCGTAVCRVKPISIMPSTTPRGKRPNDQKGRVHHLIKQFTPTIRSRRRIVAETLAYNVQHIIALKLRQTATILSGNNPPPKTLALKPISVLARERIHTSEVAMQIQHKHGEVFFSELMDFLVFLANWKAQP